MTNHQDPSALLRAVAITDRLRSPGGCPWDAQQTPLSLARYLLEESYEALDAIQAGDLTALREELGDLLFQILFHARIAAESSSVERFDIEDVAADLVAKLTRRHPHVFAAVTVTGSAEVEANWDAIKKAEKQRTSVTDGIPMAQPSLALAAALLRRSHKAGIDLEPAPDADIGSRLFALVAEAVQAGVDPELALRSKAGQYAKDLRAYELKAASSAG